MDENMRTLIALCLLSTFLTACGTKGPLYIPEKQYPQNAQLNIYKLDHDAA